MVTDRRGGPGRCGPVPPLRSSLHEVRVTDADQAWSLMLPRRLISPFFCWNRLTTWALSTSPFGCELHLGGDALVVQPSTASPTDCAGRGAVLGRRLDRRRASRWRRRTPPASRSTAAVLNIFL